MYRLFAVFSGVLIALMVTFNGSLSNNIGDYSALIIIHLVGLITIICILIVKKVSIPRLQKIPTYLFSAGALGVFMVFSNNICFNYLGVSLTLVLGLSGQSITSCIIDHFGLFGMEVSKFQKEKLLGFILIFIGIISMVIY